MLSVVTGGHIFQCGSLYGKLLLELRGMKDPLPFSAICRNMIPDHGSGIFERSRKQSSAKEGLSSRFDHQIVSNRHRQFPSRADMGSECRMIRRLVMAETGIPHQLKSQIFRLSRKNASVKFADLQNQLLHQCLKLGICLFVFCLMCMIPFPIIIFA